MLTLIFTILLLVIFGKLLLFGIKAAWGITKLLVTIVFLPLTLIGLVIGGLLSLAFPILIVVGIIAVICSANK